jgi:hypothetical protein
VRIIDERQKGLRLLREGYFEGRQEERASDWKRKLLLTPIILFFSFFLDVLTQVYVFAI